MPITRLNSQSIPTGTVSTDDIADGAVTDAKWGGGQLGRRNLIINGAMEINQRAFSSGTAGYTVDRWGIAGASSGGLTTSGLPNNFRNAVYVTRTAAAGTGFYYQRIEANNCFYLTGENVTVSFWALDSGLSSISVRLGYASETDDFSTVTTINTNTVTSSPSGEWTRYETTFASLPSGVTNGLEVRIQGTTASTGTITITGVQLEVGNVATPFEHRSYGEELALCQRYFYAEDNSDPYHMVACGAAATSTLFIGILATPVTMRSAPTLTASGSYRFAGSLSGNATNIMLVDPTTSNNMQIRAEGSMTQGNGGYLRNNNDTSATFHLDAEL